MSRADGGVEIDVQGVVGIVLAPIVPGWKVLGCDEE